jgi:hypothetical protein
MDIDALIADAKAEFEMAWRDGEAMYWWCEINRLEAIKMQEAEFATA